MSESPKPKTCDTQQQLIILSEAKRIGLTKITANHVAYSQIDGFGPGGDLSTGNHPCFPPTSVSQVADLKLKSMEKMFTSTWLHG